MIKQSLVYLGSSLVNKAVPFLLLPLLTRYLSPAEYGLLALFQLALIFFQAILGLSLNVHIARAKYTLSEERFKDYLLVILVVLFFMLALGSVLSVFLFQIFGDFIGIGERWYYILPFVSCMSMANLIYMTLLRAENKAIKYAGWEFLATVLNVATSLILIINYKMGWLGRATGITIPLVIIGISAIFVLYYNGRLSKKVDLMCLKDVVLTSLPLMPHAVAAAFIGLSDRYFVEHFLGLDKVGVYSVVIQFGMVIMLVSDAYAKAWQPFFFKSMADGTKEKKARVVKYTFLFLGGLSVFSVIYSSFIYSIYPFIVGDQFQSTRDLIFLVPFVYLAFAAYQMVFLYLILIKKTSILAMTTVISAGLAVLLNSALIPLLGLKGAIFSMFTAYFVNFLLIFLYCYRRVEMPWMYWKSTRA